MRLQATGQFTLSPFQRFAIFEKAVIEKDLDLDLADGRVRSAEVSAPLYRGFEAMLIGRVPEDALAICAALAQRFTALGMLPEPALF